MHEMDPVDLRRAGGLLLVAANPRAARATRVCPGAVAAKCPAAAARRQASGMSAVAVMRKPARAFTADEDARMVAMSRSGQTHAQIALAVNRPHSSVTNRLARLRSKAGDVRNKLMGRFSADEDARMLAMAGNGQTCVEIAIAMNRMLESVRGRLALLRGKAADAGDMRAAAGVPAGKARIAGRTVRCLGGCDKSFFSPDPLRIRVCCRCRNTERWQSPGPQEHVFGF